MKTFLGSTVKSNVTKTVMAVIKEQVHVILGVNLVGKEWLVKKVKYLTESFIDNLKNIAAHYFLKEEITFPKYYMFFFSVECIAGSHGKNCSFTCGKCLNSTACHHNTGSCDQGCDSGFEGLTCKKGMRFIKI